MELYEARDHYIVQDGEHTLWCNRFNGKLFPGTAMDLCSAWNPVCLGLIHGVVGKFRILPDSDWQLILIKSRSYIGDLPGGHHIFKINRIAILPICANDTPELDLQRCRKHHFGILNTEKIASADNQKSLQKTWNQIKSAAENVKPKKRDMKEKAKFERRILEEIYKMFHELDSFYYSPTGDLTNCTQRVYESRYSSKLPLWQRADDRFFWNKQLLLDLMIPENSLSNNWAIPVIQGYIQMEVCQLRFESEKDVPELCRDPLEFTMGIISRRSRFRAGTRVRRRGVDEDGNCANYVETEQIITTHDCNQPHVVSFNQVRGSVPVYWSQSGIKYRPPPRLDKGEKVSYEAFEHHFNEQLELYEKVTAISLVEMLGREKTLSDAFLSHIFEYNHADVTYVSFDFHEYCRGMKFENVSLLLQGIRDIIKDMRYCWVDSEGMICEQKGIFRVNCVDCLDRTNVVQTAIARVVMETQCRKLGLLPPDESFPEECRRTFQSLWANNGDAISRQYAGTVALKGDYTRTGERNITGMMKDGANSMNRYYLRFRDIYRQAAIDIMLGTPVQEEMLALNSGKPLTDEDDPAWLQEQEENMKQLIDDCSKMLITDPEDCLGAWGLIDCDILSSGPGDPGPGQEMDTILLLSQKALYVISFDEDMEKIVICQRVNVENLLKIEIGPEPAVFKSKYTCMRVHYTYNDQPGFYFTLRATSTRLFNNIAIVIKNQEEAKESLRAIAESIFAARKLMGLDITIMETKLERKKSRPHPVDLNIVNQIPDPASTIRLGISRDASFNDLDGACKDTSLKEAAKLPNPSGLAGVQRTLQLLNPIRRMQMRRKSDLDRVDDKDGTDSNSSGLPESKDDSVLDARDVGLLAQSNALVSSGLSRRADDTRITCLLRLADDGSDVSDTSDPHSPNMESELGKNSDAEVDFTKTSDAEAGLVDEESPHAEARRSSLNKFQEVFRQHSVEMINFAEALGKNLASLEDEQPVHDTDPNLNEATAAHLREPNTMPPIKESIDSLDSNEEIGLRHSLSDYVIKDEEPPNKEVMLSHSLMKTSISDTSISYRADFPDNRDVVGRIDDLSALTKLRARMANIQLPNFQQTARARRIQQTTMEIEAMQRKKLGDMPCLTRIINIDDQLMPQVCDELPEWYIL